MLFRPEFFDIFGLTTFTFLGTVSLWALLTDRALPDWILIIFLLIAVGGLIVDGIIVYHTYLKKK